MRIQFKDKISSFYQRRVDISGNVKKNYQNLLHNSRLFKELNKHLYFLGLNKEKNQNLLLSCFLLKYIPDSFYSGIPFTSEMRAAMRSPIRSIRIFKESFLLKNKIQRRIEENKLYNSSIAITSRKLPHSIRKNIETDLVEFTPYIKLQLPGFPKLINKKRKKLRKKLLIFRLRHKFKFITLLQNIALHSFIGTSTLSYANLVKSNQLNLSSIIYQYRLSKKSKQRVGYKARKFLKRPFKLSKMNQARFHISKDDWFERMQEQMIQAYNRI